MIKSRTWISALSVLAGVLLYAHEGLGQSYPAKPIRLIAPLAAGGPGDLLARAVGQKLSESLGQPVVTENRPGANTNIGTAAVVKSPSDGYTLLVNSTPLTINPHLYKDLPFDPIKDLAPISLIGTSQQMLIVHPSVPVTSVKDLIALARAKPGQLNYGSAGNGSGLHLAGEMFNTMAGVKLVHVPYKGVTDAMNDLLGGRIALMFPGVPLALPQVKAGKVRALGTTGSSRDPSAPDTPTIAEAGLPGYEVNVWYGLFAPAGTPADIVQRLSDEVGKIVQSPDIRERWAALGAAPASNSPGQFATMLKQDLARWERVVRESGAKID